MSFGRATKNEQCPHASLVKSVAEVFWGISQHIGRLHMNFLYTSGKVYVQTCKRQYNGTITRNRNSLIIPHDNWIELETMDVLLIHKNPIYLFIRFNKGSKIFNRLSTKLFPASPQIDPVLTEINRRLQNINDYRTRILGPTPLGSGSFGHVFPLCSKPRILADQNWELRALKVINIRSRESFENILRGVSTCS